MFDRLKMIFTASLGRAMGRVPASLERTIEHHNRVVDAVRVARSIAPPLVNRPRGISAMLEGFAARLTPARYLDRSRMHWGPNGAQAMARRVRQFVTGHHAASDIWVGPHGTPWHSDSHGVFRAFYP